MKFDLNNHPYKKEIDIVLSQVDFELPTSFIKFSQGSEIIEGFNPDGFIQLWPIKDLIRLNESYEVQEFAPDYFLIGSNGSDTGYAIKKSSGEIFEIPFIGMSNDEAILVSSSFEEFLKGIKLNQ